MTPSSTVGPASVGRARSCPECDSGLANCQGLLACTACGWFERR